MIAPNLQMSSRWPQYHGAQIRRQLLVVGVSLPIWLVIFSGVGLSEELPSQAPFRIHNSALGTLDPKGDLFIEMLEQSSPSRLNSSDISSEKINQFVQAYLQVLQLIEQREGQLQGAETELEALEVEREVETEALAFIDSIGLTRQEYLQLLTLAKVDPEFGERIAAQLQELT